jgi:succinate dehydrogenase hydrophobic anchor subunit
VLTAIVLVLYTLVVLFDFLPSKKERKITESIVYFALLSVSMAILVLFTLGIELPGPSQPIRSVVEIFIKPRD